MGTTYRNYSIKGSKGVFYESSKEPRDPVEGFNIRYESAQTHKVSYHKESPTLEGVLRKIGLKKFTFDHGPVTYVRIMFEEISGAVGTLSLPLMTQKGGLDNWIKAFMLYLPVLKKGQEIKISLNRSKKDDKGFLFKNVWMRDGDDAQIPWAYDPKDPNTVPKAEKIKHPITGEEKWDFTAVDKWYYDYLMKVIDAWGGPDSEDESKLGANETYVGNVSAEEAAQDAAAYDDLPF